MAIEVVEKKALDWYQREAGTFSNRDITWRERVLCASLGVAGEAGEVADMVKKRFFHLHAFDRDALKLELGDTLWYLTELATLHDISLDEIAQANVRKLQARYGEKFSPEASRDRQE